jgi:hypothetical protein
MSYLKVVTLLRFNIGVLSQLVGGRFLKSFLPRFLNFPLRLANGTSPITHPYMPCYLNVDG